jgi:hypothetical protein
MYLELLSLAILVSREIVFRKSFIQFLQNHKTVNNSLATVVMTTNIHLAIAVTDN